MWGNIGDAPESGQPGLAQGKRLMAFERSLMDDAGPHLERLAITSDPALLSSVESMEGTGVESARYTEADLAQAGETEEEFNRVLAQSTRAYKEFSAAALQNMQTADRGGVRGKTVDPGDGHYVYVNNHGYTHQYSAGAWEDRGGGCSDSASKVDAEALKTLKIGPPMRPGQPCGLSGKIIRNQDSHEIAWVDMKGYKHVFSADAWANKHPSCSLDLRDIPASEYEALPTGTNMHPAEPCSRAYLDPKGWEHLQSLNRRLVELAGALSTQLNELQAEDKGLQRQMDAHQSQLQDYVAALKRDQAHSPPSMVRATARSQSSALLARTRWYHYWVWLVTAIAVVALTARALNTDDPSTATTIIALVTLVVVLYNVVRWLHERLRR